MPPAVLKKVLVANRGEIAVRVMRACQAMGIGTTAVYSDADAQAMHVRMADDAVRLGPAPSTQSYLVQEKVIQAALDTGSDAIHPGYGFLSENAGFARKVIDAGLIWIGPSPEAMDAMGDKVSARANAERAGVPTAPGSEALADAKEAAKEAARIGYPVLLKASAGGGGIGMRVVRKPEDLEEAFASATAQAASAFGVPDVFLEKYLERPRHIEVQVLADQHGNAIHLFERECSIQRRHQKLIEEAPSPALTDADRQMIGEKAVALAKLVGYANAGTLEFLYQDGQFYFNEMNTRLQVEHPVTELVTGIDLVAWQLRIAAGEKLDLKQEDIHLRGHAIEARVNAEDPAKGFMPSPGPVQRLRLPTGDGVRVDTGLVEGWTVPGDYDSMVLKLICYGASRGHALDRMERALAALELDGFATNVPFHKALAQHPSFREADMTTRFLEEHGFLEGMDGATEAQRMRAAVIAAALVDHPGGGLAGMQLRQRMPAVVSRRPGKRDWRSA